MSDDWWSDECCHWIIYFDFPRWFINPRQRSRNYSSRILKFKIHSRTVFTIADHFNGGKILNRLYNLNFVTCPVQEDGARKRGELFLWKVCSAPAVWVAIYVEHLIAVNEEPHSSLPHIFFHADHCAFCNSRERCSPLSLSLFRKERNSWSKWRGVWRRRVCPIPEPSSLPQAASVCLEQPALLLERRPALDRGASLWEAYVELATLRVARNSEMKSGAQCRLLVAQHPPILVCISRTSMEHAQAIARNKYIGCVLREWKPSPSCNVLMYKFYVQINSEIYDCSIECFIVTIRMCPTFRIIVPRYSI